MSNLALIRPQRQDFITCQVIDWLDGLPVIVTPAPGGAIPGVANVGVGSLVVSAVDAGADLAAVQIVRVSAVAGGLTYLEVADLDGSATGSGVVGLPVYAAGVTFTLSQVVGQPALAVGDTFALTTLPVPVDLTGLVFTLDSRIAAGSATYALQATSVPGDGSAATIANGGAAGTLAMRVPQATMARCAPSQSAYPYNLYATDPATGQRVIAFFGLITHQVVLQPQT
ncbi:hypothetical protein [Methylobacterium sp. 391_Methyba4]|uniref:hypothetical protein n=1 Tax=Methylobacterium sp. 391_Methyba4 TaxID=3038924 RepID=UPI00241ED62C|nr:hypothetical protein [Methylobacterium sp. 391_Methyba4]WFS07793.1 hypothetical protein P9K36_00350 [Methylobacterium sp. 391_Methyba4]